ncbi:MAG TPA: protein kinase, partial [Ktedonobacteraceae bacterium]|nr:protein kinase [Ktedonobacteraceae bacterium]
MAELEGKILGRYELKELIGRGSMAEVYKGYDRLLKREIAVKVFKHTEEQMLLRFIREAEVMSQMSHPHLVTIYDSDSSLIGNIAWYYYIMPLMKGSTLRTRIQRSPL